jgi:hypothetical protein
LYPTNGGGSVTVVVVVDDEDNVDVVAAAVAAAVGVDGDTVHNARTAELGARLAKHAVSVADGSGKARSSGDMRVNAALSISMDARILGRRTSTGCSDIRSINCSNGIGDGARVTAGIATGTTIAAGCCVCACGATIVVGVIGGAP